MPILLQLLCSTQNYNELEVDKKMLLEPQDWTMIIYIVVRVEYNFSFPGKQKAKELQNRGVTFCFSLFSDNYFLKVRPFPGKLLPSFPHNSPP